MESGFKALLLEYFDEGRILGRGKRFTIQVVLVVRLLVFGNVNL